jgi:ferredoxin like protein
MSKTQFGTVSERLDKNRYETDAKQSHIQIDQAVAKSSGAGPLLVRICPAHVYSMQADNTVGIMYAA